MKNWNTVADLIAASFGSTGQLTTTKGYTTAGDGGAGTYLIKTAAQAATDGDVIDEIGAGFTLADTKVAVLQPPIAGFVKALQYGVKFDDSTDNYSILNAMRTQGIIDARVGGVMRIGTALELDSGQGIIGNPTAKGRSIQTNDTVLRAIGDIDCITYNGTAGTQNLLKDLYIDNTLAVATSTSKGINFTANGGASTTRALANNLENVVVNNFSVGYDWASAGDFAWFGALRNVHAYKCKIHFRFNGSNGATDVFGLHVDSGGGFAGSDVRGIEFMQANGINIFGYSIENCAYGISTNGTSDNDRAYMYGGYIEGCSERDISITADFQLYMTGVRFSYFSATAKAQSIKVAPAVTNAKIIMRDAFYRGDQAGLDGLIRLVDNESSTDIHIYGLTISSDITELWATTAGRKAPAYVDLLDADILGNDIIMRRTDVVTRMACETISNTTTAPSANTFIIQLPTTQLDLKDTGAIVKVQSGGTSVVESFVWSAGIANWRTRSFATVV